MTTFILVVLSLITLAAVIEYYSYIKREWGENE